VGGFKDLAPPFGCFGGVAHEAEVGGLATGTCDSQRGTRVVLWDAAGRPTLLPSTLSETIYTIAEGLNARGWVVGQQTGHSAALEAIEYRSYGTVWIAGVPFVLEDHLEPGPPVQIFRAMAVNWTGQIACVGRVGGEYRALRLDPSSGLSIGSSLGSRAAQPNQWPQAGRLKRWDRACEGQRQDAAIPGILVVR
jgi:hypothetical protein